MKTISTLLLTSVLCTAGALSAQTVNYGTAGASYTENFNANLPGAAATLPWTQGEIFNGWYAEFDSPSGSWTNPPDTYRRTNGRTAGIRLFHWRSAASATDGALGAWPINDTGDVHLGIGLTNSSLADLSQFSIGYTGQQWFSHNTADTTITVAYQIRNTGSTSLTSGTWTTLSDLTFTSPISDADNAILNGSDFQEVFDPFVVSNITWSAGQDLWIRFTVENINQESQGLAVNDFNFTAIPEPAAGAVLMGLGALLLASRSRRRKA